MHLTQEEGSVFTDHKRHNWQLPGPTRKCGLQWEWRIACTSSLWTLKAARFSESWHWSSHVLSHRFPAAFQTQQTGQPPQPATGEPRCSGHSCPFQPPAPLLFSTAAWRSPREPFPFCLTPFTVFYSWSILYPIQPKFEMTFSFPECKTVFLLE